MSKYSAKLMTEGSIWKRIVAFAIPLFWGNLFQQLYNTADSLIVGNFLGSSALAAVSSSGNLIFLMVGLFNGIAIGSGVIVAKYYGARDIPNLQKSIHTTVGFGLICGVTLPLSVSLPHHRSWCLWEHRGGTSKLDYLFPDLLYRLTCLCHVQLLCRHSAVRR